MKELLTDYCAAVHPDDFDAQDKLFDDICSGAVKAPSPEEMQSFIQDRQK